MLPLGILMKTEQTEQAWPPSCTFLRERKAAEHHSPGSQHFGQKRDREESRPSRSSSACFLSRADQPGHDTFVTGF